jgi:CRP-like cAMP-binding protein
MTFDADFNRLFVGNVTYVLLVISMMMTRMLWLRLVAIGAGATGVIYAVFWISDPVITFWESVFTLVNVAQILLIMHRNYFARFSEEERMFYDGIVPKLEPHQALRLLRVGEWRDAEPGSELIRQGQPVSHLLFLRSGKVSVVVDNKLTGICAGGSLIGEIGISTNVPATATILVVEPVHYLAFEREALQKVMHADPEIANAMDHGYLRNLEKKLVNMNEKALSEHPLVAASPNNDGARTGQRFIAPSEHQVLIPFPAQVLAKSRDVSETASAADPNNN